MTLSSYTAAGHYSDVYLVQNHICDVWKALGFVHAGTDELEAQQEFPIVLLLLLWINGLPVL